MSGLVAYDSDDESVAGSSDREQQQRFSFFSAACDSDSDEDDAKAREDAKCSKAAAEREQKRLKSEAVKRQRVLPPPSFAKVARPSFLAAAAHSASGPSSKVDFHALADELTLATTEAAAAAAAAAATTVSKGTTEAPPQPATGLPSSSSSGPPSTVRAPVNAAEDVTARQQREIMTFQQREKRKRALEQTSRATSYVEEEKRLLRESEGRGATSDKPDRSIISAVRPTSAVRREREQEKRSRGQSSIGTWKSEAEMILRQQFD